VAANHAIVPSDLAGNKFYTRYVTGAGKMG
jgi:hypothetical protein